MSRGPLFSGYTYSRVSKNCRSMTVSAAQIERLWSVNENWRTLLLLKSYRFVLAHFHIYNEFTIPQLPSYFDKFSWTESLVRSGIDSRLSLNFFKVLRNNNQNTKDSLRSWPDLWRALASFHGCFRCFSLGCKAARRIARLKLRFLAGQ